MMFPHRQLTYSLLSLTLLLTQLPVGQIALAEPAAAPKQTQLDANAIFRLFRQGLSFLENENYKAAIQSFKSLRKIAQRTSRLLLEAQSLENLGVAYTEIGQSQQAVEALEQAEQILRKLDRQDDLGRLYINLGRAYQMIGDYPKARVSYQRSLQQLEKSDKLMLRAVLHSNLGTVEANAMQYKEAIKNYNISLDLIRQIPEAKRDRNREASALLNLGNAQTNFQRYAEATANYQQALEIAQTTKNLTRQSQIFNARGGLYVKQQQYGQAIPEFQRSLALATSIQNKPLQASVHNNLGHAFYNAKQFPKAITQLNRSLRILDNLRRSIRNDRQRVMLFDTQIASYNLLQQIYAADNQPEKSLEASEQGRSRALLALLSQDQDPSRTKISIASLKQIAKEQNATLVEYSFIPPDDFIHRGKQTGFEKASAIYIWVVSPQGKVSFEQIDLGKGDTAKLPVKELIQQARQSIGVPGRNRAGAKPFISPAVAARRTEHLRQLHRLLIKPIQRHLPPKATSETAIAQKVIFVPQAQLFSVPFPALLDDDNQPLIAKYAIATTPSIQSLGSLSGRKRTRSLNQTSALIVGNPIMPTVKTSSDAEPKQLSSLIGAESEARAIAAKFDTEALIGEAARKEIVVQRMQQASIIHLATHGLLDSADGGMPGSIALAPNTLTPDKRGKLNDGLLSSSEIAKLQLNAELAVLSACDTGNGEITGDGVIGLSRALLMAGVPTSIVSIWKVPDDSTDFLMQRFYQEWLSGKFSKVQALRFAMLSTRKERRFETPVNWAAFTLIGNTD